MDAQRPRAAVDVIVPVYGGLAQTRRCLESVLAAPQVTTFELVVVDDRSPEPEVGAYLDILRDAGTITLLRNEANLGFVASVNRGMALHPERDVVLLNSDTEVANDWLDRLCRCLHSRPDIGTVTPFSNNATICSYPRFCVDNPLPEGVSLAELDASFARVNAGKWIDIPTAVGFCMVLRRACLARVGPFDAQRFGRGYGEENDFSRRAAQAGWRNVLCGDTFVYHAGGVSFGAQREALQARAGAVLLERHPDYDALVRDFVAADPAADLRRAVAVELAAGRLAGGRSVTPAGAGATVQLHVAHDLGGGVAQWLRDYCRADRERTNLILRPYRRDPAYGAGLALYADAWAEMPLRLWLFDTPIAAVAVHHAAYRQALAEILAEFRVGALIVSSLVGHALDVLDTGLPTVVVAHDYFPYCPAINLHFEGVCEGCDADRLGRCARDNADFNPFIDFPAGERLAARRAFVERLGREGCALVAPSQSVLDNLGRIEPALRRVGGVVIPHGLGTRFAALEPVEPGGRLRILILGMLAPSKGVRLLEACIDAIGEFADLHLVGSAELGALFEGRPHVQVQRGYALADLPAIVSRIRPHLGLLTSVCAETFGYTLSELMMLGVPPLATRVGSFAERIHDGLTGYLVDPAPAALLARLREIDADRATLVGIALRLRGLRPRTAEEMVADYHRLLMPVAPAPAESAPGPTAAIVDARGIGLAMEVARRWKEVASLHLSLGVKDGLLARDGERLRRAWTDLESCRREVTRQAAEIAEIRTSTSWRLSRPVRWLGTGWRTGRAWLRALAARPVPLPAVAAPAPAEAAAAPPVAAAVALAGLSDAVREAIRGRIRALVSPPRISVLVPVYDAPEDMLRAMLDSVLGQLYPHWQLCLVDDASPAPHVRRILEDYAARDVRVSVQVAAVNGGVSRATNLALAMADGAFTVLLDHDDLLEEQALYRVAEAVLEADPDMLYSDEYIVAEDGETVQHAILRPAFSPEYLRCHPYIVHLLGFRTAFLRALGGLDESLAISQDYDLVLRASERAQRILHIAEPLYRWRTHAGSAGHRRMHEVMAASRRILARHLERCGEAGEVRDGPAFNFFDVRYPLISGFKVAIVIPTHNRGDLVRICIDSLRRSLGGVAHEIVLIDHQSDDPESLAYFASLRGELTLLHYRGPFNFGAINNWAAAHLAPDCTHILFCNNDIEAPAAGWLERMLELGQKPDVGIVGAKLFYPDRQTLQHAGVVVACCGVAENLGRFRVTHTEPPDLGYIGSLACNREVSAVTAACMLIRRTVFEAVGGFDEEIAVGYGDVDLCLRVGRAGYRVLFCAHAELLHHESASRGRSAQDPHPADTARFVGKWPEVFAHGDPYFNPQLAADSPNWQVALPLRCTVEARRRLYRRPNRPTARSP